MRALLCPDSLKGVLTAREAAAALREGFGGGGVELPIADGGEGTADAIGGELRSASVSDPLGRPVVASWRVCDGVAVVDSAAAIGLPLLAESERDPMRASSAGLGELLLAVLAEIPREVIVGVGGTATVDGGAGLLGVLSSWPEGVRLRVACDVRATLLDAARVFAPQKGATAVQVAELEQRLATSAALAPFADLPGAGAGGGLGAALASIGGELVEGAELVLDAVGFDDHARNVDLVVTGEGTVDATTFTGKAPGAVVKRCDGLGVRCVLFGGRVLEGAAIALSGDPSRAREDLLALGERLARGVDLDPRLDGGVA